MKKYLIILFTAAVAVSMLFMGIGCSGGTAEILDEEEMMKADIGGPEENTDTNLDVIIKDFAFEPSDLTIKTGDTVTWKNNDGATHTVKMDTFESGNLPNGESFSFTFSDAGTYEYICGIHPSMHGKIIVE